MFKIGLIGRSNVGKSTLLNKLLGQNIAKISKKPGRTRKHIPYRFSNKIELIDLPGYGYAKISKERRAIWDDLLMELLSQDDLRCMISMVDLSIKPQKIDQIFIQYLIDNNIEFIIVFNKIDKQKPKIISEHLKLWNDFVELGSQKHFLVAGKNNIGVDELKKYLNGLD